MSNDSNWKAKRKRRHLRVSASQFETYEMCARKWWFDKIRKLPTIQRGSFTFGTVLHSVIERWMKADDQGYDRATGEPVNIFPARWQFDDTGASISPDEEIVIRKLVEAAIENGTLHRLPGRRVEQQFHRSILKTDNDTNVEIIGYIDVDYDDRIEDHKSTKSMRWAKTPKTLRENTQILVYAMQKILSAYEQGIEPPATVLARHNIFCKDPKKLQVKHVEVELTREEIEAKWSSLLGIAEEMTHYRDSVDLWHEIPDPPNPERSCNAYGGCPYMSICSGQESPEGYEERVAFTANLANNVSVKQTQLTVKGSVMGTFADKIAAKKKRATGAPPSVVKSEPPIKEASDIAPPWANSNCMACKGAGFNSRGNACQVCNAKAAVLGKQPSSSFDISTTEEGKLTWTEKGTDTPETGTVDSTSSNEPVKQAEDTPPPTVDEQKEESSEVKMAVKEKAKDKTKGGRPRKGFVLCVNTVPISGTTRTGAGRGIFRLDQILIEVGQEMADREGKESFYDLDVWDRRAQLARLAKGLSEQFGTDLVVALGVASGTDLKALVDALRPFAGMEIIPCDA